MNRQSCRGGSECFGEYFALTRTQMPRVVSSDVNVAGDENDVWSVGTLHIYDILMIPTRILLDAYRKGYFPMSVAGTIEWYSPEQRGVVPLDEFRIPKR